MCPGCRQEKQKTGFLPFGLIIISRCTIAVPFARKMSGQPTRIARLAYLWLATIVRHVSDLPTVVTAHAVLVGQPRRMDRGDVKRFGEVGGREDCRLV